MLRLFMIRNHGFPLFLIKDQIIQGQAWPWIMSAALLFMPYRI